MIRSAALLLMLAVLLPACGRPRRVDIATREKILLLGNGAEPRALDPHIVQSVGDSNIMRALFETLVTYHPFDDTIHLPGVAKTWEANDDFTRWSFHLRDDARWSNGDPVTAGDFVYAYHRILHPDMRAPYASMLYFLKNAKAFNLGEISDFTEVGVSAPDDHTLVCDLEDPTPYLPDVVKHPTWVPLHRATIEKFGGMTRQYSLWQRPGNLVSNGPFVLSSWRINDSVKVERNPCYWDAENVALNGIVFYPYDNNFTEERAFRGGLIHKTYIIPPSLIDWHQQHDPGITHIDTYAGSYFFRCNVTRPPLDDKN
ncbi:MAG: peptide ABC transporter substrate-binding protein, partial [Verrucomicrobiales bacterium]